MKKKFSTPLALLFCAALCLGLMGAAGTVGTIIKNIQFQGQAQSDLDMGGHNATNLATLTATNVHGQHYNGPIDGMTFGGHQVASAATNNTADFDPAGAAATAQTNAEAASVPTARTVNGHALSADVTVAVGDLSGIDSGVAMAAANPPNGIGGDILLDNGDGSYLGLSGNNTVAIATRAYTADTADAYYGVVELNQIDGLDSSNITPLEFGINTASGFVTQTGGDARYVQKGDTIFAQTTTDISQTGTTLTDTSLTLTLTPGTYVITAGLYGSTASTTGGVYLALSGNTGDTFQFIDQWARGTSVNSQSPIIYPHFGSGATHLIENTGDAPDQYVTDNGNGRLTVATTHAYAVQLAQWSAEDDTNPAILKAGSWIKAVRQ